MEGDDYWTSPLKLQRQIDFLEANNDYSICFHKAQLICEADWEPDPLSGDPGKESPGVFPADLPKTTFNLEDLLVSNFIPASSIVFRNYSHGKLPDMFSQLKFLDWPLAICIAGHGKISFLNEIMSVYRLHSGSAWRTKSAVERTEATIEMLERVNAHLEFRYDKLINNTIRNLRLRIAFEEAGDPLYMLLSAYWMREDLQTAFPEVRQGKYKRLLQWAKNTAPSKDIQAAAIRKRYADWLTDEDNPWERESFIRRIAKLAHRISQIMMV